MAWVIVVLLGVLKWPFKVLALIVVPFLSDENRINHPLFGVKDAKRTDWYFIAVRNGAHNLTNRPTRPFQTWGNTNDPTLEKLKGFQWRYRKSLNDRYVSFRCTWGSPRPKKGKREFYIGWTMNEEPNMRLTFFQLRPF